MAATTAVIIAGGLLAGAASGVARNQLRNQRSGALTSARSASASANATYQQQKQDARNKNQAPDANALNIAKQQEVMRLQQGSGRASTFLSNGLGG